MIEKILYTAEAKVNLLGYFMSELDWNEIGFGAVGVIAGILVLALLLNIGGGNDNPVD